jgi:uncharacterized protein with HEPN domain
MTDPTLYRDDSRVRHILGAIERIIEVGADMSRDQLRKNEAKTESILFNFMIMGEAANNISREFASKNPEIDWKGIAGVRHKVVHDYADIDYDTIWDILKNEIPEVYSKIKALVETLPHEPTQLPPNIADFL